MPSGAEHGSGDQTPEFVLIVMQKRKPLSRAAFFLRFDDFLCPALRAGQLDLADVSRHAAIGAAGAFDVLVFLVGKARLCSEKSILLRLPPA